MLRLHVFIAFEHRQLLSRLQVEGYMNAIYLYTALFSFFTGNANLSCAVYGNGRIEFQNCRILQTVSGVISTLRVILLAPCQWLTYSPFVLYPEPGEFPQRGIIPGKLSHCERAAMFYFRRTPYPPVGAKKIENLAIHAIA